MQTIQEIKAEDAAHSIEGVNAVVADAMKPWELSDRLYRLSLKAYQYTPSDWIDHRFDALCDDDTLVGILVTTDALDDDLTHRPRGLLIQGLYVVRHHQGQGAGGQLIHAALTQAKAQGADGCFVKAHETAVSFFQQQGFELLPVRDPVRDYPYRLFRSVNNSLGSSK
jgi:Predicted acetyltransferase